jgi:Fe-S-cluster-containing dehydrogenase component
MKLGLVVDLDTCVGCHASGDSATACMQWKPANTSGCGSRINANLKCAMSGFLLAMRGEK